MRAVNLAHRIGGIVNSTIIKTLLLAAVASGAIYFVATRPDASEVTPDSKPDSVEAPAPTRSVPSDVALTAAMQKELGAATWVPENSAYFSNSLRLGEQWRLVRDSEAFRLLLELPGVQMLVAQAQGSPAWSQFEAARQNVPMVNVGLDVLADAFSQEMFVCLDERWKTFVPILNSLYVNSTLAGLFAAGGASQMSSVIDTVVADPDASRMPGALVGFRMSNPKRAHELLVELIAQVKDAAPLPLREETIGGSKYFVLRLDGSMIPSGARVNLREELESEGVSADTMDKFDAWLRSQTLSVAIGLRDDYLLISVGGDTSQLEALGTDKSLAAAPDLAPIRGCFKPGVLSLSYLCAELSSRAKLDVDGAMSGLNRLLDEYGGFLPDSLPPRIRTDAAGLLNAINKFLPDAQPELSVSFLNGGIESYSFMAAVPNSPDTSRPLSILAFAGASPLVAVAGRSAPAAKAYDTFVHWVKVGYGYFEDFAVPAMSTREQSDFDRFQTTFLDVIRALHETTKNELIPSLDTRETMFVLDGGGTLSAVPGVPVAPSRPLRYPRPAIVMELNGGAMLTSAMGNYRKAINDLIDGIAEIDGSAPPFKVPAPESRPMAGGTMYFYPVPLPPEVGLLPNAVVKTKLAVLSLSESHSAELLKVSAIPDAGVVDFGAAAGGAVWVDVAGIFDLIFDDVEIAVETSENEGVLDPGLNSMIRVHLPSMRTILGVFRHYASVTWIDGKTQITHSRLRIVDAAKQSATEESATNKSD